MEQETKHSHGWMWFLIAFIAVLSCVNMYMTMDLHKLVKSTQTEQADTITYDDSLSYQFTEATVDDIIEYRNLINADRRIDSIYMNMPEVALRALLMEYGTSTPADQLVEIYNRNRSKYNNIIKGANIQKEIDHQLTARDSIKRDTVIP